MPRCRGEGRVEREKSLEIKIPAGVDNGSRLRIAGEGEAGELGAGARRLVCHRTREGDTTLFERRDANLYCTVSISFAQAALGGEVTVPTLDGEEKLRVAEGTQGGMFRLKGKGMPVLGGRGGDLYVASMWSHQPTSQRINDGCLKSLPNSKPTAMRNAVL